MELENAVVITLLMQRGSVIGAPHSFRSIVVMSQ